MIYLTFIGNHDDRPPSSSTYGAAFTIFRQYAEKIGKVYIFVTPSNENANYSEIAKKNKALMLETKPNTNIELIDIIISNPIDYDLIYPVMLDTTQKILDENGNRDKEKIVNITSGTPTMTACWVVLSKSGLIPNSKLIQSFEQQYAQQRGQSTQVVDFSKVDDFPEIKVPDQLKRQLTIVTREKNNFAKKLKLQELDDEIPELIGESRRIREIKEQILTEIDETTHVLILGDPGTGKQVIANAIWRLYHSEYDSELDSHDCGILSETLILSELFGHVKGAFTGANENKSGLLKKYDNRMVFLDEIGNLPIIGQRALLRYIYDGEFRPVGSDKIEKVNTQILAATNKDVYDANLFAQDLKDRFEEIIELPPLKERKEDIPLLIKHFLLYHSGNRLILKEDVIEQLINHNWPGNIRELENFIKRLVRKYEKGELALKDLPDRFINIFQSEPETRYDLPELPLPVPLSEYTELIIEKARIQAGGKHAEVDRLLRQKEGIEKQRQYRKRKGS